jgi:hypothetical protein
MKFILFALALFFTSLLQAQDFVSYNETYLSLNEYRSRDFNLRAPPIRILDFNILHSFKFQNSRDLNTDYSQFRFGTSLIKKLDENHSVFINAPISYSSTGHDIHLSEESAFTSLIFSISNKWPDTTKSQWSYGLLMLDLNFRARVFPLVGFNYFSEDGLWRAGIGYPALSINYLGIENTELSILFSRESTKFYITSENPLKTNGAYIEQNLNSFGLGFKTKLSKNLRLGLVYSGYFSSQYKYLNDSQNEVSNYLNYNGSNSISVALGFGMDRN